MVNTSEENMLLPQVNPSPLFPVLVDNNPVCDLDECQVPYLLLHLFKVAALVPYLHLVASIE